MYTLKYKGREIQYNLSKENIHIADSYKIKNKSDMSIIIRAIREDAARRGFEYKRSESSWITEWRAHNFMYECGIEKTRTGSVDLNENESKIKLIAYSLMSVCYMG